MATYPTLDARIKKEQRRIARLYKNLPKERLEILRKLIERAAYMLVSLEEMEEKITQDGLVTEMPQGGYTIQRAHPLLAPYNAMVKNFGATVKQLGELLPSTDAEIAGQALLTFAAKRPPAVRKA